MRRWPLAQGANALVVIIAAACGNSYAAELSGKTTVQQRVGGGDPATAFRFLDLRRGGG